MPVLSGPALDKVEKDLKAWYFATREKLIEALEESYPYGSVKVPQTEQWARFISMEPEDWMGLIVQLQNRYRGDPNSHEKVSADMAEYVAHMLTIASSPEEVENGSE